MTRTLAITTLLFWSATAAAAEHVVTLKKLKFDPKSIDVAAGDTVVWKNEDENDHTITSDDKSFKAGKLAAGASYKVKFEKAGKFPYHCDLHPRMKATVVVKEKDGK